MLEASLYLLDAIAEDYIVDVLSLAIAASERGDHREAIAILSDARKHTPHEYEILANLGTAYLAATEWEHAIQVLSEAIELRPDRAHAHCMIGLALHESGRSHDALRHLREACRLDPSWAASHYNLGLLLEALKDVAGARLALLEAERLSPHDPDIRRALELLPSEAGFTGDLETFRLPELIEFLRMKRATGTIEVTAAHRNGHIDLFEGDLFDAWVHDYARHSEVKEQLIAALAVMMSWSEGEFVFHARQRSSRPAVTFDTQTLMLEAARRTDEAGR